MNKVSGMVRNLEGNKKDPQTTDDSILVICTYGRDQQLTNSVECLQRNCEKLNFRYVKKTAPSLNNILTKSKWTALGASTGHTLPCDRKYANGKPSCHSCQLMSCSNSIKNGEKVINTAEGTCLSRLLIYHAACKHCNKCYVGKTVQCLVSRINGHRNKFYSCLRGSVSEQIIHSDDDYALGLHLVSSHGLQHSKAFNESYTFTILEHCSPFNLDLSEHLWIHKLKCIKPFGLNSHDPFGIPLVLH